MTNSELFNLDAGCIDDILQCFNVKLEAEQSNQWVMRFKHVDSNQARELLQEFDRLYCGNGVNYVRNPRGDSPSNTQGVSYLIIKDAYTPTLCYFHKWEVFRSVSWGDALEMMENSND